MRDYPKHFLAAFREVRITRANTASALAAAPAAAVPVPSLSPAEAGRPALLHEAGNPEMIRDLGPAQMSPRRLPRIPVPGY